MNKKIATIYLGTILLLFPFVSSADNIFVTVIRNITFMILWPVVIGLVIVAFIYAGFLYLTAQGEPGKIADANKALIYAVIGIIIAIAAFSASGIIQRILGL